MMGSMRSSGVARMSRSVRLRCMIANCSRKVGSGCTSRLKMKLNGGGYRVMCLKEKSCCVDYRKPRNLGNYHDVVGR